MVFWVSIATNKWTSRTGKQPGNNTVKEVMNLSYKSTWYQVDWTDIHLEDDPDTAGLLWQQNSWIIIMNNCVPTQFLTKKKRLSWLTKKINVVWYIRQWNAAFNKTKWNNFSESSMSTYIKSNYCLGCKAVSGSPPYLMMQKRYETGS